MQGFKALRARLSQRNPSPAEHTGACEAAIYSVTPDTWLLSPDTLEGVMFRSAGVTLGEAVSWVNHKTAPEQRSSVNSSSSRENLQDSVSKFINTSIKKWNFTDTNTHPCDSYAPVNNTAIVFLGHLGSAEQPLTYSNYIILYLYDITAPT